MIRPRRGSALNIWLWPVLLGMLSAAGLAGALIGDGWWDIASTAALGVVTLVCFRFWLVPSDATVRAPRR
ncbi:hypothetical protein [Halopseudomonas salina]|uniref:Uncharacterized protein n=1 Tax=Halopseudomonas salina TaxID=1323744 RepID=A0ABQ1P5Y6_9GAMM|nr:hypothetical protein [Halopseudomonas salina]GGC91259.1 hypothetical protein GCM10007418_08670 [Halopseudomonas salina]